MYIRQQNLMTSLSSFLLIRQSCWSWHGKRMGLSDEEGLRSEGQPLNQGVLVHWTIWQNPIQGIYPSPFHRNLTEEEELQNDEKYYNWVKDTMAKMMEVIGTLRTLDGSSIRSSVWLALSANWDLYGFIPCIEAQIRYWGTSSRPYKPSSEFYWTTIKKHDETIT